LEREYFEELYGASDDPWDFSTSGYEKQKYDRTLAALGARRFTRALEVGCSIGVFTAMLAPYCGELLAVDASEKAVALARERLSHLANVRVERRTMPEEMPEGPFDLIVVSEVLYYFDRDTMLTVLGSLQRSLGSGGTLLAVHWRHQTQTYPLQGDEVHGLIRSGTSLSLVSAETTPDYRLELYEDNEDNNENNRDGETT
jgi:cyclopropane fatty-acyl-phospholipid synthase-like methyltransferase